MGQKIEPNMLCQLVGCSQAGALVSTIRKGTEEDILRPADGSAVWLVETLSPIRARMLHLNAKVGLLKEVPMTAEPGTQGWVSECFLKPLPGLDDDTDTDTAEPKIEELDHAL
jgi:hypothetical protein